MTRAPPSADCYKPPVEDRSYALETPVHRRMISATPSPLLQFASMATAFAERLRGEQQGDYGYAELVESIHRMQQPDPHGEHAELADLIELAAALQESERLPPH